MIGALFRVLGAGLDLWAHKEKHKYIDKLLKLKKDWYEEINRPLEARDNAALDRIERELRELGEAFAAGAGKPDA